MEALSNIFLWEYNSLNYKNDEIIQALQTAAENDPNSEVREKAHLQSIWAENYN